MVQYIQLKLWFKKTRKYKKEDLRRLIYFLLKIIPNMKLLNFRTYHKFLIFCLYPLSDADSIRLALRSFIDCLITRSEMKCIFFTPKTFNISSFQL